MATIYNINLEQAPGKRGVKSRKAAAFAAKRGRVQAPTPSDSDNVPNSNPTTSVTQSDEVRPTNPMTCVTQIRRRPFVR